MPKSLSPSVRRQIIEFDPLVVGGPSVSEFCLSLGISRPSFYNIKRRFLDEGNKALNPHSSAPKKAARTFDQSTTALVLLIRIRLEREGWDNGPKSIWFTGVDTGELVPPVPSVATIARILASAGATKVNPRKRPRSSWMRFSRSSAMEMWQLDAFSYRLSDENSTGVTVYQLLDDSTRFDVGTMCFLDSENGTDAITTLSAAIEDYGVPQELLSDNGVAFNQSRRGNVSQTEKFLADRGCLGISGRGSHPQTQGKNERSHQTLLRFLDANAPDSLERLRTLIEDYRNYYNYRRRHQALPGNMTPGQAWEAAVHRPSDGVPISYDELQVRADSYRATTLAQHPTEVSEEEPEDLEPVSGQLHQKIPKGGRLRDATEHVVITYHNAEIHFQGLRLRLPRHLSGTYQVLRTSAEYTMFEAATGEETVYIPLPIRTAATRTILPLWQVKGARIRDPKPDWLYKQRTYEEEHFPAES